MSEVKIIVSGPVGSGKSALLGEIEIMLKAIGISVRYEDEGAAQAEKIGTHADWISELEASRPSVMLVEDMPWFRKPAIEAAAGCQLVPIKPTQEMCEAPLVRGCGDTHLNESVWRGMLAAAPVMGNAK